MPCRCVIIAHTAPTRRTALVAALFRARPDLEVVPVAPDRLDAVLTALDPTCRPVVVCSELTTLAQQRAHGWVVETEAIVVVGSGDTFRTLRRLALGELVTATLDRVDAPAAPPWTGDPALQGLPVPLDVAE
jgi:hypothetical protein